MSNLSTLLRNLADIIDANDGQVPAILLSNNNHRGLLAPPKKNKKINNRQAFINARVQEVLFTPKQNKK